MMSLSWEAQLLFLSDLKEGKANRSDFGLRAEIAFFLGRLLDLLSKFSLYTLQYNNVKGATGDLAVQILTNFLAEEFIDIVR